MNCPECKNKHTRVWDSRLMHFGTVKRRRRCMECNHRFTTAEIYISGYGLQDKLARMYKWLKRAARK